MKHWKPVAAREQEGGIEPQSRDAWIAWLTHAPLHGVSPDRHKPAAGWAGFGVLGALGAFWLGAAWIVFGR